MGKVVSTKRFGKRLTIKDQSKAVMDASRQGKRVGCLIGLIVFLLIQLPTVVYGQRGHVKRINTFKLSTLNMALTGTAAVVRGFSEGRLETAADAARAFAGGAVGGYGFYHAKRLAGKGRFVQGVAMAYASASVVENVSQNRHPLGYVRLGFGPLDFRVRTPFSRSKDALLAAEVNALGIVNFVLLPLVCCQLDVARGALHYRSNESLGKRGRYLRDGQTFNRSVVLGPKAGAGTFAHEMVHLLQSLQVSSVTPFYRFSSVFPNLERSLRTEKLAWNVQFDWLYLIVNASFLAVPYEWRWAEREAYTLDY